MSTAQATPGTYQTAGPLESLEKPSLLNLPAAIHLQIYIEVLRMANMKTRFRILSNYVQARRQWLVNAELAEGVGPWRETQHTILRIPLADESLFSEQRSRRDDLVVFMQDYPSSRAIMQTCKKLYSELFGEYAKLHRDIVYLLSHRDCWYNVRDLIHQQSPTFLAQIQHLTFQGVDGWLRGLLEHEVLRHLESSRKTILHSFKLPNLISLTADLREEAYHWSSPYRDIDIDIHSIWQTFRNRQAYIDKVLGFVRDLRDRRMPSVRLLYRFSIGEKHTRWHRDNLRECDSWTKIKTFKWRLDDAQNPLEEEISYHPRDPYAED